jgi:predicted transcriptional regulator
MQAADLPMVMRREPDRAARLLSHLLVAIAVGTVVGNRKGAEAVVISGFLGAAAHELLDAPVAGIIRDVGL